MSKLRKENLASQLIENLQSEDIVGLPREWFTRKDIIDMAKGQDTLKLKTSSDSVNKLSNLQEEVINSRFNNLTLEELESEAIKCRSCKLCETRNKVVFGIGKTDKPRIVFIGEGPGAEEDMKGEPFVGRAGQLLTAAINKGMGLNREDVYICNVVKCRPPQNRTPLPDEVEACSHFLYRQIELLQPEVIVTLGQPAQLATCGIKIGITKLRGQWQEWRGFKLMPTLHPAYLLRNPPAKKFFWEDLQEVMRELGIPIPKQS